MGRILRANRTRFAVVLDRVRQQVRNVEPDRAATPKATDLPGYRRGCQPRNSVAGMSDHWRRDSTHLIAHRGASLYAAENSPAAIEEAARRGATDVEIDLNMTKDGVCVAAHDGAIGEGSTWISQRTYDELCGLLPEAPVRFEEILDTVADVGLGIYIDVKQIVPGGSTALERLLRERDLVDRAVAASFRSDLAMVFKNETMLTTSVLFHDPGIDVHSLVLGTHADFVHPCFDVFPEPMVFFTPAWVDAIRATGCGIVTWNTLDVEVARSVLSMGATGVCSDDPEVLVRAVRSN